MADEQLPGEVHALVRDHLATVAHLEVLILLACTPGREFSPDHVAAETPVDAATADGVLHDLAAGAVVAASRRDAAGAPGFDPLHPELGRAAGRLGECYARFPAQVVRALYEQPEESG